MKYFLKVKGGPEVRHMAFFRSSHGLSFATSKIESLHAIEEVAEIRGFSLNLSSLSISLNCRDKGSPEISLSRGHCSLFFFKIVGPVELI